MSREPRTATTSRRAFLKALGTIATALPFYKLLENNFVHAQSGQLPLKFLGLGFFHGTTGQLFSRRPGETDTNFRLDYEHSPFKPFDDAATYGTSFKSRINIFEGFDFAVGKYGVNGQDKPVPMHGALGLLMTGSCMGDNGLQNASIDQYLAAKYGGSTRFRSLQLRGYGELGFPLDSGWCVSYDAGGVPLAPLHDPIELWDKFFTSTIVGSDQAAQAAAARKRAIGASILDFVVKDIGRMNQRLAAAERQKLDQHLTVIRGLERRLDNTVQSNQCAVPARRDPARNGYVLDKFQNGNILPICDFNVELLAEILVCDLTRFATFVLPNEFGPTKEPTQMTLPYDGMVVPTTDGTQNSDFPIYYNFHDNCAHRLLNGTTANAVQSQRMVSAINRTYFSRIARIMRRLDQAGILDSTVILAGSDGGDGAGHSTLQVPILLAGGANGAIKLGKRIVAPGKTARAGDWCADAPLSSHNPILVAVANLFGENLTSYGTCGRREYTQGVSSLLG